MQWKTKQMILEQAQLESPERKESTLPTRLVPLTALVNGSRRDGSDPGGDDEAADSPIMARRVVLRSCFTP